jgi:hypothetical protein
MGLKLFLVLLASLQMILSKETVQKGGVLFEDIGGAQINREFMTYKRIAYTSILQTAAQTATDLTTLYSSFCQGIHNDLKRAAINHLNKEAAMIAEPQFETLITPLKYHLKEAERACSSMNARQPEIHNFEDHKRIQQKALRTKSTLSKQASDLTNPPTCTNFYQMENGSKIKFSHTCTMEAVGLNGTIQATTTTKNGSSQWHQSTSLPTSRRLTIIGQKQCKLKW